MRPARLVRLAGTLLTVGCQSTPVPVPNRVTVLPEVARGVPTPDVTQVSAALSPITSDPGPYLALAAEECRHLAAANSAPARLIEEAARTPAPTLFPTPSRTDELRQALAPHLAAEARNRTAAGALEAYYRLLEAELLADVLGVAIAELDALNTSLDALAESGLPEPADAARLRTRRLTVRAERETAKAGARRLSEELLPVIGAVAGAGRINPTDVIVIPADDLNPDQAVAYALAGRPDVNAARLLESRVDARSAGAVTATLAALTPGLPELPGGIGTALVSLCRSPDDLKRRATELRLSRERAAAGAVRGAVADWNSARAAVAAAKVLETQEAKRVASEQARESAGVSGGAVALRTARLAQIEAQVGVIRAAARWKLADVAVRRELGLLAAP